MEHVGCFIANEIATNLRQIPGLHQQTKPIFPEVAYSIGPLHVAVALKMQ